MRRNLLKRKIALGLSLLMLSSSTGTWAESVQTSELAQETQETSVEEPILQVDGENQEAGTEASEVSVQAETLAAETEAAQYPEEVSIYQQETTAAAEVLPETVLESTVESILPAETLPEESVSMVSENGTAQEYESSTSITESIESTEIQTTIEDVGDSMEEASEQETESEAETELESELESESETQELESFEEPETDGYLEDILVEGDFKYQVSNNQATILGYLGSDTAITIPATIGGYPVTTIGYRAFYKKTKLTEIKLPTTLETIEEESFFNSGITSIIIPENVKYVKRDAFSMSQITRVEFVQGATGVDTIIGDEVFKGCLKLKELILSNNIVELGINIIGGTQIESIVVPNSVEKCNYNTHSYVCGSLSGAQYLKKIIFEEGIKIIPEYIAYYANALEQVVIPEGVTEIGARAFYSTPELTEVKLPSTLETIGESAFEGSGLINIEVPESVTKIAAFAFCGMPELTEVKLPSTLKTIEMYAFFGTKKLTKIILPTALETIGKYAFSKSGITSIVIPESVKTVESCAFCNSELTRVEFVQETEHIGTIIRSEAFSDCQNLKELILSDNIVELDSRIISGTQIESIVIPKSVEVCPYGPELGQGALSGAQYLKEIIFAEGMKVIPSHIAYKAQTLEQVVIPESVTEIGSYAFFGTVKLPEVKLPSTLETIGKYAFSKSGLTNIEIPKNVTELGANAFYETTKLTEITLSTALETIGEYAFSKSEITSIVIPKNTKMVGEKAFSNNNQLTRVEFGQDADTAIGSYAFENCQNLKELKLPDNVTWLGIGIINGTQIESIVIPKSVTTCDRYSSNGSLSGAQYLKEIIFEHGMKKIPASIAYSSQSIERVVIPSTVEQIEKSAFYNCSNLTIYGIPGTYAEVYANKNQIPFISAYEYYPDFYKKSDYVVKITEKSSGNPISGAKIAINGEEVGTSDENGLVKFNCYATVTQKIKVTKIGYKVVHYTGMPWSSTSENTVELESAISIEPDIKEMFPNIDLGESTLYGPQVNLFGLDFYLFKSNVSFDLPLLSDYVVKYDETSQTFKILIGFKDQYKAELKDSEVNGSYWTESYKQVKSLVKACGGEVDNTKLWNQFSKLRGKLKSVDGSAAFGVNGKITGFIELKNNNGNWSLVDGGVVANLTASASMRMPLCYIFYAEFGLKGSVEGKLNFTLNNQKTYDMSGSIGLKVTPSVALGANAALLDVQGGVSGTLDCTFSFPAQTMKEAFRAIFTGKLFLKVSSPVKFFNGTVNYDLGGIELYPDFGAYLDISEWHMAIEDRVVPTDGQAYEYADTQTVTLSDGRSVKVYITDDGTKSTGNHTTLMYSIYSNGGWSTPQPVCETGRADMSPVLRTDGSKAYVVWMNIGKVISADATEADVYQNTDLWYSELNGDTFSTPERVQSEGNKKMEFSYDLCVSNGTAAVVWVENSANDPFMQSGNNSIYSRIRQNGNWQSINEMTSTFDMIGALQASMSDSNISVQYSDGTNMYSVSGSVSTEIGKGTSLKIFDGITYYLKDSQLYFRATDGTEKATGIFCSENYQVYNTTVYWTQQNGYKSELYMQKLSDANIVQLTYDDGYISDFSIYKAENGTIMISYTWCEVNKEDAESPYGAASRKTITGTTVYDLVCEEISYDADEIKPSNRATFNVKICNHSSDMVNNVRLRVRGKNQSVIYNSVVLSSMAAGEEKEVSFTYKLPISLSGLQLSAEVYSSEIEDANYENNIATCVFAETDLAISNANEKSAVISNNGYTTAKAVRVEVRVDSALGTIIAQTDSGTIEPGATKTVEYTIPEKYLKFKNASYKKTFYISVVSDTSESLMADNFVTVQVEPEHADGITMDEENVSVVCGEQRKLNAVVTGGNAVERSINWCSSNTDIVTVDETGMVTAVSVGESDVTAISVDGGYTATCHITVVEPLKLTSLTLSKTSLQLTTGETAALTCICEPEISEEHAKLAKWTSNNDEVAVVVNGVVTAVGEGYAEITVELGGLVAYCEVEVEDFVQKEFSITEITATAYNKLKISWSAYEEADGYAIYRMNDDGSYSILKYITDKTILSYVNTVTCGVTYTYKAASYRLDGKKKVFLTESEPVSAKALPAAPELQSTNMAAYNKIRIIWTKVNGCEGYVIYRSEAEDGKYSVLKTVTQATATNYVNIVKDSTVYYYKVRAFVTVNGKKVYGDYSSILSGNVITGSPQNFTIKQAANGKITFTWNKVEDADGYVIYLYYPDTNKYKAIKNVTDIDVLTYGKKMTKGATYHFAMRAYRLVNGVKVYSDYGEIVSTK